MYYGQLENGQLTHTNLITYTHIKLKIHRYPFILPRCTILVEDKRSTHSFSGLRQPGGRGRGVGRGGVKPYFSEQDWGLWGPAVSL